MTRPRKLHAGVEDASTGVDDGEKLRKNKTTRELSQGEVESERTMIDDGRDGDVEKDDSDHES